MATATAAARKLGPVVSRAPKRKMAKVEPTSTEVPMSFQSPESSTIDGATYDPVTHTMAVHFRRDAVYDYADVPPAAWAGFVAATSKGQYFGSVIRPLYTGVKRVGGQS